MPAATDQVIGTPLKLYCVGKILIVLLSVPHATFVRLVLVVASGYIAIGGRRSHINAEWNHVGQMDLLSRRD